MGVIKPVVRAAAAAACKSASLEAGEKLGGALLPLWDAVRALQVRGLAPIVVHARTPQVDMWLPEIAWLHSGLPFSCSRLLCKECQSCFWPRGTKR